LLIFSSSCNIHSLIQSFIHPFAEGSLLYSVRSVEASGCPAGFRTLACRTASRRTTVLAELCRTITELSRTLNELPRTLNPHQNDQGWKGPCFFQRLIALKCLKCQKIKKNI
jgi:hypothetical protein